jgi:hypothetical protein
MKTEIRIVEVGLEDLKLLIGGALKETMETLTMPDPHRLLSQREVTAKFNIKRWKLQSLHDAGILTHRKNGSDNVWLEGEVRDYVRSL